MLSCSIYSRMSVNSHMGCKICFRDGSWASGMALTRLFASGSVAAPIYHERPTCSLPEHQPFIVLDLRALCLSLSLSLSRVFVTLQDLSVLPSAANFVVFDLLVGSLHFYTRLSYQHLQKHVMVLVLTGRVFMTSAASLPHLQPWPCARRQSKHMEYDCGTRVPGFKAHMQGTRISPSSFDFKFCISYKYISRPEPKVIYNAGFAATAKFLHTSAKLLRIVKAAPSSSLAVATRDGRTDQQPDTQACGER